MIILPPNFKYVDAISYRPIPFEPYQIILVIKDKYGTIIGIYEYKRIAETTVHYVEFITPSEEGPYIIEKWYRVLADSFERLIEEDYILVSESLSPISMLQSTYDTMVRITEKDLNHVVERMRLLLEAVERFIIPRAERIRSTSVELSNIVDNSVLPRVRELKQDVENLKSVIENEIATGLNDAKSKLEMLLRWIKKRKA